MVAPPRKGRVTRSETDVAYRVGPMLSEGLDLTSEAPAPGYHLRPIQKGEVGELSKIREELEELEDAAAQGVKIMELVELSDLHGAIEAYIRRHHAGTSYSDLAAMSAVTRRAFENGHRG